MASEKNEIEESGEALEKKFLDFLITHSRLVKNEQIKRAMGYKEPEVLVQEEGEYQEIAKRLVEIQNQQGFYTRKNLSDEDYSKLKVLAKKKGMGLKEVVGLLISNDRYLSPEEVDVQNLADLAENVRKVADECSEKFGGIPLNALSQKSRDYLSNKKIKIFLSDKLKLFIQIYCPELKDIPVIERSNLFSQDKYFKFDEEKIQALAEEIKSKFADENGKIDAIFGEENEDYFTELLGVLRKNRLTFEEFMKDWTDLSYTRVYSLDTIPAVKQMVQSYFSKRRTFRGITSHDPYLRDKIDVVEKYVGRFGIGELLEMWGLDNDTVVNDRQITFAEISKREENLVNSLSILYPEKIIDNGITKVYPEIYDKALSLSKRFNFKKVDDYFKKLGFTRINDYEREKNKGKIMLSERDLFFYNFIGESFTEDMLREIIECYGVTLLEPETNKMNYRKLVAQKKDSTTIKEMENLKKIPILTK